MYMVHVGGVWWCLFCFGVGEGIYGGRNKRRNHSRKKKEGEGMCRQAGRRLPQQIATQAQARRIQAGRPHNQRTTHTGVYRKEGRAKAQAVRREAGRQAQAGTGERACV